MVGESGLLLVAVGMCLYVAVQHALRTVLSRMQDHLGTWTALLAIDGLVCQGARWLQRDARWLGSDGAGVRAILIELAGQSFLAGLVVVFGATYLRRPRLTPMERAGVAAAWLMVFVLAVLMVAATDGGSMLDLQILRTLQGVVVLPVLLAVGHIGRLVLADTMAPGSERALVVSALFGLGIATMVDASTFMSGSPSLGLLPFAFALQAVGVGTASRLEHARAEKLAEQQAAALVEHNQRLDRALAEAEQARETRARFIANVSHELRTPVNGVVGLSSLLSDTPLDIRQRELVDHLINSARAMRGLVDDVLDFARIDAGHVKPTPDWHDPRTLVCEVLATLAHAAYEKGLGLEARAERDLPLEVFVDGFRLRQVLLNLVGNAVKFTGMGAVTVRSTVQAGVAGPEMTIEVKDTGPGIEPTQLRALFEPFIQGDQRASRSFGGSGLGLAISRELVVALGGSIEVESQRDAGSVFRVRLPVGLRESNPRWSLPLPQGTRVLVIDWDGLLRFALEPLLDGSGAMVTWRRTISDVADAERYDLILDGTLALTQEVDAVRRRSGARWIACPRLDDRVEWPKSVAPDAVLYRPLFPRRLVEVLIAQSFEPVRPPERRLKPSERTMLVVDDNPVNLLVACRFVERLGYPVRAARGGEEALAVLDRDSIDTILMDCQMPGMDGFETTRQVRIRHGHRVRIIALTASALDADRTQALASGMDGYLVKPVDFERLREALRPPWEAAMADEPTEDAGRLAP